MGIDILTLAAARAGKGSGGSASKYKQPDWGVESTEVLKEQHLLPEQANGMGFGIYEPLSNDLVVGEKYIVMWNDTEYTCIAKIGTAGIMLSRFATSFTVVFYGTTGTQTKAQNKHQNQG